MNPTTVIPNSTGEPPPQSCGLALASLILGIAGIVTCLGPFLGIPGVVCGHVALSRIRASGGRLTGEGLAVGGLITGYVAIAMIVVIALLAAIAIPNFVRAREAARMNGIQGAPPPATDFGQARQSAQRAACILNLRQLDGAKQQWALENRKTLTDRPSAADLCGADKYIREEPACPANGRYTIGAMSEKPTSSIPDHKLP